MSAIDGRRNASGTPARPRRRKVGTRWGTRVQVPEDVLHGKHGLALSILRGIGQ